MSAAATWADADTHVRRIHAEDRAAAEAAGDTRKVALIDLRARLWADAQAEVTPAPARVTSQERLFLSLKLASPLRAPAGRVTAAQRDAGHLPLFVAANEPTLFEGALL